MNDLERTNFIASKIGKRRIRLEFPSLGITGKMSIQVIFPKEIDISQGKKELGIQTAKYIESIKPKLEQEVTNYIISKISKINEQFSDANQTTAKNQMLWEFKLNVLANTFDTENWKSVLNDSFSNLRKSIIMTLKKAEGKKIIMDWIDNNPYLYTFPLARSMKRKFIFHMGPTNSGKTYQALQDLKQSNSGSYLAPLRLLAHEVYDDLNKDGIYTSMITGEERIEVPGSTVVSSTIEMANFNKTYDVCIIDEIQMITDKHRGWAWVQAVCGIPAEKIYLAGSEEALPFVQKLIVDILQEDLEIVEFKRKNDLIVENKPFDIETDTPKDGDAFIVFSRKNVFGMKADLNDECSIIYGSLSPEVRKSEARKFREGDTNIIVSTDAIGMGLNLPISRIIFVDSEKFNGVETTRPDSQLVKQIAGRAGRFGKFENGYVTALDEDNLSYIRKCLEKKNKYSATDYKFQISPNVDLIKEVSSKIGTTNLHHVLHEIREIFLLDETFSLMNIENMIDVSGNVFASLPLDIKFIYSCSPINVKYERDRITFRNWSAKHASGKPIMSNDISEIKIREDKNESDTLWYIENQVKLLSCYQWLSGRFPDIYPDQENIKKRIDFLNEKIIKILDK